jgi:septum formation protein
LGGILVEGIQGCYYNVVGLPISKLSSILRDFDVHILSDHVVNANQMRASS